MTFDGAFNTTLTATAGASVKGAVGNMSHRNSKSNPFGISAEVISRRKHNQRNTVSKAGVDLNMSGSAQ